MATLAATAASGRSVSGDVKARLPQLDQWRSPTGSCDAARRPSLYSPILQRKQLPCLATRDVLRGEEALNRRRTARYASPNRACETLASDNFALWAASEAQTGRASEAAIT
jgi:hypothetical protein